MAATTLYGPLTAFQPPSSCFNQIWLNSRSDVVLGNPYNTGCKPAGWNTLVQYSPALCPSSYYSADGRVITRDTTTETVMDCCPMYVITKRLNALPLGTILSAFAYEMKLIYAAVQFVLR